MPASSKAIPAEQKKQLHLNGNSDSSHIDRRRRISSPDQQDHVEEIDSTNDSSSNLHHHHHHHGPLHAVEALLLPKPEGEEEEDDDDDDDESAGVKKSPRAKRRYLVGRVVLGVTIASVALFLYSRYSHYFTLEQLQKHRLMLKGIADAHPRDSAIFFVALFIGVIALNLPGATVLSFAGGLCFPQPWATIYSVIGCSFGASVCFILARAVFGDFLRRAVSTRSFLFRRMRAGLERNQFLYMVFFRFMIIIPFWFVNVSAAILGVPLLTFALSTSVAVIPGSFLYTTFGVVLADIFDTQDTKKLEMSQLYHLFFTHKDMRQCFILLGICGAVPISIYVYSNFIRPKKTASVPFLKPSHAQKRRGE